MTETTHETAVQFPQIAVGPVHILQVQRQLGVVPFRQVALQQKEAGGARQGFRFRAHRQMEQGHGPQEAGVRAVAECAHQPEQGAERPLRRGIQQVFPLPGGDAQMNGVEGVTQLLFGEQPRQVAGDRTIAVFVAAQRAVGTLAVFQQGPVRGHEIRVHGEAVVLRFLVQLDVGHAPVGAGQLVVDIRLHGHASFPPAAGGCRCGYPRRARWWR